MRELAANGLAPRIARTAGVVLAGVVLMTLSAKVQIPFWPVPMTLQTMAAMGLALACGPRLAMAIVAAWLAAGIAGMPVFAGTPERGIGLAYVMGPTGGYLLGYLLGTGLAGWLGQGRGILGRGVAMVAGMGVVYALGLVWLAGFVPAGKAFALGAAPFLPGDAVKIALVAVAPGAAARLRRLFA